MYKKLFIFLFTLSLSTTANAQQWDSLKGGLNNACRVIYADTIDNYIYATGSISTVDHKNAKGIARWNGVQWDSLRKGIDGLDTLNAYPQNTLAITRYKGKLYVGGAFASLGNVPAEVMGTWDGVSWDTLSPQPFKTNYTSSVFAMEVIDSELYIGGIFDSVAGFPCKSFAKWNGISYTNISFPPAIVTNTSAISVNAICKYNGEIYIGGNFNSPLYPSDTIQNIIRYDGTNWQSVGGGMRGSISEIESMAVYNSELYVAGYFTLADGNAGNFIQKWNGTTWSGVGGGLNGQIHKLLVYHNKLYALGAFNIAGGISAQYVAEWDGTNWCGFGSSFDNVILTGCVYNDSLYIGGGFITIDGDNMHSISKWVGGTFTTSCGNTSGINESHVNNETFNIYPSLSTNQITIEFDLAETKNTCVEIKNILGQTVKTISNNLFSKGTNKIEIDVSEFSNGIYFAQLQSGNKFTNKKFIKQ